MAEPAYDRLTNAASLLETAKQGLTDATRLVTAALDEVHDIIHEQQEHEAESPYLQLRPDGKLERMPRTTRVTNSHEPARGVNTRRVADRLNGSSHD